MRYDPEILRLGRESVFGTQSGRTQSPHIRPRPQVPSVLTVGSAVSPRPWEGRLPAAPAQGSQARPITPVVSVWTPSPTSTPQLLSHSTSHTPMVSEALTLCLSCVQATPDRRNMSSLFSQSTKSLVRELGRKGELLPADSLTNSPRLRPFCLLRKKHKRHPWPWDTPFIPTDFSLLDMLEPGCPVPGDSDRNGDRVNAGLLGKVTGSSMVTHSSALALHTLTVSPHTWETLVEKRELESRKERESLYVVTEVLETSQDATLQSLRCAEGAGQLSFLHLGHCKGQCQSHLAKEKMVTVPKGSVLAYRVLQLVMEAEHWGYFSFPSLVPTAIRYLPDRNLCRDAIGGGALGEEPNFLGLQRQVGAQLQDLATLTPELRHSLLDSLRELLRIPGALQGLEDTLEQALCSGQLVQLGDSGPVLSTLLDPCGSLSPERGRAVLYLLGALVVLSDTEHCLLAQSLERHIVPQHLELGEDAALVLSLVQSCGLGRQGSGLQLIWDPEAIPQLSALYGVLTGLQLLDSLTPRPSRLPSEEGIPEC
ncbi:PREDICTED: gasdermin-A-like [Chrysochloris asiatica]|uniref:Gasdermin-A-like n=1 Tax=Chrysochloris asiatica TaxID=185453 RepID=A0A9B0T224_CHRAS|nr:PREDICTED: gasdermin-A-like [Chrysochloris asiatica]